jgi:hypothetical protein
MIEGLQIKVKSLASEAAYIRKVEEKQQRIKDFESQAGVRRGSGWFRHGPEQKRPEPRVYPEPREDTQEVYDEATVKFFNLHRHRTHELRKAARISHLAYGFLRGTPYSEIENKTHDRLDTFEDQHKEFKERRIFDLVRREAKRFAPSDMDIRVFAQKWAEWIEDAKNHLAKQVAQA